MILLLHKGIPALRHAHPQKITVHPGLADKPTALRRAKAIAEDGHGYVILLDDSDIEELVAEYLAWFAEERTGPRPLVLIRERFDSLIGIS